MIEATEERPDTPAWLKVKSGPHRKNLEFEFLPTRMGTTSASPSLYRARVPAGWLVVSRANDSVAFVPDPSHEWDGASVG
jgi:hypothetical protein